MKLQFHRASKHHQARRKNKRKAAKAKAVAMASKRANVTIGKRSSVKPRRKKVHHAQVISYKKHAVLRRIANTT